MKSGKKQCAFKVLAVLAVFALGAGLLIFMLDIKDTNRLILIVGVFFFYFFQKEVELSFWKKLFWFCTACLLGAFCLLFSVLIDSYFHPEGSFFDYSPLGIILQVCFGCGIDILFYVPVKRYMGWVFDNFHEEKIWKVLWLFPVIFITISLFLIPQNYDYVTIRDRYFKIYSLILFMVFGLVLIIYTMFYRIARNIVEKEHLARANQFLAMQAGQYTQLLSHVQETSRIRHDFRHQLTVISELLNQKEYKKLALYIQDYVPTISQEIKHYSSSAAVNAVLSHYEATCREKGIRTDFRISMPETSVKDMDFCIFLGNLLENAVFGCEGTEEPYISLKMAQTAPHILALKIINPYIGEIRMNKGVFLSSRHSGPGMGLDSVKLLAEQYHGSVNITCENGCFTVRILLKM
ncbi:MAG: GHKL domain-containing protein [Eubacteriales bacterium]|nr:GHKL domain-containing protein [Eubacteriales bacterium]